ncbi:hypothetical protein T281_16135 [Rhodomicrobium udaipurense JA643]|nr:hypothetical protein T281_16135 [Rhodomicrobium udaipurense JA643]
MPPRKPRDLDPNTMAGRIQALLDATGKPQTPPADSGLKPSTIQNILNERSRRPQPENVALVAKYLGTTVAYLETGDENTKVSPLEGENTNVRMVKQLNSDKNSLTIDVPVLGVSAVSTGDEFLFTGERIDYVRRPERAKHMQRLYAFFVAKDNMYPRFDIGELIYVNPDIPPSVGDDIVIELAPEDSKSTGPNVSYLKRLKRRTPEGLVVEQFNPHSEVSVPIARVICIHRVMTIKDLLGV